MKYQLYGWIQVCKHDPQFDSSILVNYKAITYMLDVVIGAGFIV